MILSDISVRRPVFALVVNLLLVVFGAISFMGLPVREYPDINPPVVSIDTTYRGASAAIIESRITRMLEDLVSGIEGIKTIDSRSQDGLSTITIEFELTRDIDAAANDVRERLSRVLDELPDEADPPEIYKVDANTDVILWLNLSSPDMNTTELTDYAERYLVDKLSTVSGVARVRVAGGSRFAMRIWLDRLKLAARNLTVEDVVTALNRENVELPAGRIESTDREFTVRTLRNYRTPEEFSGLILRKGTDGHLVRLGDVARVESGPEEDRSLLRGNGEPMVGLGIIKQSTANTLAVALGVREKAAAINETLPDNISIDVSYDTSVFIERSIIEVYMTLAITTGLVVMVIYLFLGNIRAMLIPAVTVPVSLIASFMVLAAFGYSVNILTLLALILAIGLVVDDAIVVLENIVHRIQLGEPPLLAAFRGSRQVGFAVVATTAVLVVVFIPIAFLQGNVGRLFVEFAVAMAASVIFSSVAALSLAPMMCSKILRPQQAAPSTPGVMDRVIARSEAVYDRMLRAALARPGKVWALLALVVVGMLVVYRLVPQEFAPNEDRGAFFVLAKAQEGTSLAAMERNMIEVEKRVLPLVESGEATRVLTRVPGSFGGGDAVNSGLSIVVLEDWGKRRSIWEIMGESAAKAAQVPDVMAFPVTRRAFGGRTEAPVQFVLGGSEYDELGRWRDIILPKIAENKNLLDVDYDYKETKPQLLVKVDTVRAGDLGVAAESIGRTLEAMLGERRATTYIHKGEEYDVILEGERRKAQSPADLENLYVRSDTTGQLIPLSNLVTVEEVATSASLNRYNRTRAITFSANLAEGYRLGDALEFMETTVRENLPAEAGIDYKGESREYMDAGSAVIFTFALALVVVFLVLAAQFESFIHPLVIMLTVPLAVGGALVGLWLTGQTINIYSQIGIVMLVGLATKNGILIVEFANQLRSAGTPFDEALRAAAARRFRPIIMTSLTTIMGAVPLVFSGGAGAESRLVLGVVIMFGVALATLLTLVIIPVAYQALCRNTGSPDDVSHELEAQRKQVPNQIHDMI